MSKWYQKASVQTALVSGVFLIIVSLGSAVFSLYQENIKLTIELQEKIDSSILDYSKNSLKALKEISTIKLEPDFSSFESAEKALTALNEEEIIYSATVNLTAIHRYISRHGRDSTKERFKKVINNYSLAHDCPLPH